MFRRSFSSADTIARTGPVCAALTVGGALLSLLGWYLAWPPLTDWVASGISMMPNTAFAVFLSGVALGLLTAQRLTASRIVSSVAGAIGIATLVENLFHVDLGLDQLLIACDWGQSGTIAPGRMGIPASFMLALINLSIILSSFGITARRIAAFGSSACIAVCMLSIIGFLYDAESFYVIPGVTAISINTAILLVLLSIGLLTTLTDVQPMSTLCEPTAAGALVRRALPVLVLVPLFIGWLRWEGQEANLYDANFGVAFRTIVEICLLLALLWWMARAVSQHEQRHQKSEQALLASEQRYFSFIQHSSEGIWRIELVEPMQLSLSIEKALDHAYEHGRLAECNDAMAHMYGYQHGHELVGARLQDLLPRTTENETYLKAFFGSGLDLQNAESVERDRTGRTLYFSNSLIGIVEQDRLVRVWGVQRDITERKLAEEALRESDRRKDEFLATLAHELRNPLSPLVSGMEWLSSDIRNVDPAELDQVKAIMRRQLEHMVRLIDDLMDISRITRGKIELRLEHIELVPVLNMALGSCKPLMDRKQHTLEVSFPNEPLQLNGDAVRLAQVFLNILNNAAKYTPDGGLIRLMTRRHGNEVIISIQDNGIGLATEDHNSIFEMFNQVESAHSRAQPGLGIGLALVKQLVEKHEGSVEAISEGPGKGTTIEVRLPLVHTLEPVQDVQQVQ